MVGAFFMPGEICFLCPFSRKEVSTVANRIMGITVEIGGDTTKLQTALKEVISFQSLQKDGFGDSFLCYRMFTGVELSSPGWL